MLFIDAVSRSPQRRYPIYDELGRVVRILDMGWEEFMVGAEHDGDQHRTSRPQFVKDRVLARQLEAPGWHVVRAIKEDGEDDVVWQAWDAMVSRGWRPT